MDRGSPAHARHRDPADHLHEVAQILALAIHRLRARQGALRGSTEETVRLDFTAHGSGHATPRQREVSRT
jgi:hypothetical protein